MVDSAIEKLLAEGKVKEQGLSIPSTVPKHVPIQDQVPELDKDRPEPAKSIGETHVRQAESLVEDTLGKTDISDSPTSQVKEVVKPPEPLYTATVFMTITDISVDVSFDGDIVKISPAHLERALHITLRELHKTHVALRHAAEKAKRG